MVRCRSLYGAKDMGERHNLVRESLCYYDKFCSDIWSTVVPRYGRGRAAQFYMRVYRYCDKIPLCYLVKNGTIPGL